MKKIFTILSILGFGFCLANPQSSQSIPDQNHTAEKLAFVQVSPGHYRPRLIMQDAYTVAEKFIADQHIDIAQYYLHEARYTLWGDKSTPDSKKIPGWYFWWVSETQELGNYVEIFVDMDGHAWRAASM